MLTTEASREPTHPARNHTLTPPPAGPRDPQGENHATTWDDRPITPGPKHSRSGKTAAMAHDAVTLPQPAPSPNPTPRPADTATMQASGHPSLFGQQVNGTPFELWELLLILLFALFLAMFLTRGGRMVLGNLYRFLRTIVVFLSILTKICIVWVCRKIQYIFRMIVLAYTFHRRRSPGISVQVTQARTQRPRVYRSGMRRVR